MHPAWRPLSSLILIQPSANVALIRHGSQHACLCFHKVGGCESIVSQNLSLDFRNKGSSELRVPAEGQVPVVVIFLPINMLKELENAKSSFTFHVNIFQRDKYRWNSCVMLFFLLLSPCYLFPKQVIKKSTKEEGSNFFKPRTSEIVEIPHCILRWTVCTSLHLPESCSMWWID